MTPEQKERLAILEERIVDQMLDDIDPMMWPGYGESLSSMDKDTRGDAMWARKIAVHTVMLAQKVQQISIDPASAAGKNNATGDDVDKLTKKAEQEADKLLKRVQKKAGMNADRAKH